MLFALRKQVIYPTVAFELSYSCSNFSRPISTSLDRDAHGFWLSFLAIWDESVLVGCVSSTAQAEINDSKLASSKLPTLWTQLFTLPAYSDARDGAHRGNWSLGLQQFWVRETCRFSLPTTMPRREYSLRGEGACLSGSESSDGSTPLQLFASRT